MKTSASTTSGLPSSSFATASSPLPTTNTSMPSSAKVRSTTFCIVTESSASNSFCVIWNWCPSALEEGPAVLSMNPVVRGWNGFLSTLVYEHFQVARRQPYLSHDNCVKKKFHFNYQ